MMLRKLVYIAILLSAANAQAQEKVMWSSFYTQSYEERYHEELAMWYTAPLWKNSIESLNGIEIQITGYVIALDTEANDYVLSAFPFSSCFFCGQGGPESIMLIELSQKERFKTDDVKTFVGKLEINPNGYPTPLILKGAHLK